MLNLFLAFNNYSDSCINKDSHKTNYENYTYLTIPKISYKLFSLFLSFYLNILLYDTCYISRR